MFLKLGPHARPTLESVNVPTQRGTDRWNHPPQCSLARHGSEAPHEAHWIGAWGETLRGRRGLTLFGTSGIPQERFLGSFMNTLDSPARLTLVLMMAFYGFAWFRRVRGSEAGFCLSLLLLTIVGGHTISLEE